MYILRAMSLKSKLSAGVGVAKRCEEDGGHTPPNITEWFELYTQNFIPMMSQCNDSHTQLHYVTGINSQMLS